MPLKCDACGQALDITFTLICKHQICQMCRESNTRNNVTHCPQCQRLTSNRNVKAIHVSPASTSDTNFDPDVCQSNMQDCENNISIHICKLKDEIIRTKEITRVNENELQNLYEKRIKELENHFGKLEMYLKEESKNRLSQIERLIETLIEIRDAMKSTREDLQSLLSKTNGRELDENLNTALERHNSSLYLLNITIPEYLVQIEPSDTFLIKDSISISAPDMPQVRFMIIEKSIQSQPDKYDLY